MLDSRDLQVEILRFPDHQAKWNLVVEFMALRKAVFVDRLKWNLFHSEDREFEQYDYLGVVYIIVHCNNEVVGGARLIRTDWQFGVGRAVYSYMIRDAWRGMLPEIPPSICDCEPPVSAYTWELTRLTATSPGVAEVVLQAANDYLSTQLATKCLFLGSASFMRMARRMGFRPVALGPRSDNRDGSFIAFSCEIRSAQ